MDNFTNYGRRLLVTGDGEPSGKLDWITDSIRVVLVNASRYTFDVTHKYLSDIPENARVYLTTPLIGKFVSNLGAVGASNVLISSLVGEPVGAFALVKDVGGVPEESPFFFWIDTYSNLPAIPNGAPFEIHWPTNFSKIFRV